MKFGFKGKVAFVSGALSGIGAALVQSLLAEGAHVLGCDLNAPDRPEFEKRASGSLMIMRCDVGQEDDVAAVIETGLHQHGRLDLAFNNAGAVRPANIVAMSLEEWNFTVDVCLKGIFLCLKHQAPAMKNGGSIVNMSSVNSYIPAQGFAAYTSAKAGVAMLSTNAALEFADRNIRVNSIMPGLVATPGTKLFMDTAEVHRRFMERIPQKRPAKPEEIAASAMFLASDAASYITGASLVVDGGWSTTGYPDVRFFMEDLAKSKLE